LDQVKIAELTSEDKKLLEKFENTQLLSMVFCGVKSLSNLPTYKDLDTLELSDNRIQGEELAKLASYPKLYKLRLSNNQISSIQHLAPLANIDTLTILDLDGCPVTSSENYRDEVFKVLPKLQVLDMTYKGGEAYYSEEGRFL
jgi:acidic leucine-rich nuclear phosphoprotein 32 family protein A/C/D